MDEITRYYINKIADHNYNCAKIVEKEQVAEYLLEQGLEYFKNDRDDIGSILRTISKKIREDMRIERINYNNSGKKTLNEVWDILNEAIPDLNWSK